MNKSLYAERKKKGLCTRCGKMAKPGRTRCQTCTSYTADWMQARYDKRRLRGVCVYCGRNKVERFTLCAGCRFRSSRQK